MSAGSKSSISDIAIIGAGPYGLSIAAHLRARGVDFRIFGSAMQIWRQHMPRGMLLKSDGFASDIYEPSRTFTLARYCAEHAIPYTDLGLPVRLETFASYGIEFQRRFVPELEECDVVGLERGSCCFLLHLVDGETVRARRVIVAVGISYFQHLPEALADLPREFVTHSSAHSQLDGFKGRRIAVIGAGASALDVVALLHQAGAAVQLITRRSEIPFHGKMRLPRTLLDEIRWPSSGLGPGWRSRLATDAPLLFYLMPERFRLEVVRRHLGPAPGWFVKDQVVGKVPFILNTTLRQARVQDGRVHLDLLDREARPRELVVDHVIAGTGYVVDLRRLPFLDDGLQVEIRSVRHTPALSTNFESSVPGLYFVGVAAANNFGPLLRFAFGAKFTARRLSRHLARPVSRRVVARRAGAELAPRLPF
jgi:thioredoxin reductase